MRATGIVRRVDKLGRVVLPMELRRTMEIGEKDPVEIYVGRNEIILKKYEPSCVFCGKVKDVVDFKGHNVCPACIKEIAEGMSR